MHVSEPASRTEMRHADRPDAAAIARMPLVDGARGFALVAMTVFHFCWDLAMFRQIDPQVMTSPGMIWFARSIAGSFLFIVGFSIVLAHQERFRARSFAWRMAKIIAAASAITAATWFATPDAFIFFGILHHIALASLLALLFLQVPWWANAALAMFFLVARDLLRSPALDDPWWWWTGLSQITPVSNDYVPVFPFFGMVLAGIAAAQWSRQAGFWPKLAAPALAGGAGCMLRFIGRHSLVYYLLHQPVMIALIYAALRATGRI